MSFVCLRGIQHLFRCSTLKVTASDAFQRILRDIGVQWEHNMILVVHFLMLQSENLIRKKDLKGAFQRASVSDHSTVDSNEAHN